jgi:hypothetical protein
MGRHPKFGFHLGGRQTFLVSLLFLIAFLPNFLLPLVYYVHLDGSPLPTSRDLKGAGLPIICSAVIPGHSRHDSDSCPICLAAHSFQDYVCSPGLLPPDIPSLPKIYSCRDARPDNKTSCFLVSGPRAPPLSSNLFRCPSLSFDMTKKAAIRFLAFAVGLADKV